MLSISLDRAAAALKDILWPRICLACGSATEDPIMCHDCLERSRRDFTRFKIAASDQISPAFSFWKFDRDAPVRAVLHRLKYGNCPWIGLDLGALLAAAKSDLVADRWDLILPVPLHRRRLLDRGYNQSEWIAAGLGRALGVEVGIGELIRRRNTMTQTNLTADERKSNLEAAFSLAGKRDLNGLCVLLVDDTLTTGATLQAAALTLLEAGVAVVQPVAVARAALRRDEEQPDAASVISSQNRSFLHESPILGYDL